MAHLSITRYEDLESVRSQFSDKVMLNKQTGCQEWHGQINNCGYGLFNYKIDNQKKTTIASRAAYMLHHRIQLEPHIKVRHTCVGNRSCVTPGHLTTGTQRENLDDMKRQGRSTKGKPLRLFTDEQVREIRTLRREGMKCYEIAEKFGCLVRQISRITNYHCHKDVSG